MNSATEHSNIEESAHVINQYIYSTLNSFGVNESWINIVSC